VNEIVRNYIFATVQLAKLVAARAAYIVDPVLKRRLETANEVQNFSLL
jgi:hypothetical protein